MRWLNLPPLISPEGDCFSGSGFFITRRKIDLYPEKTVSSGRYKVVLDAAISSFLRSICTDNIEQVLSYIDTHEFDATQNVFYSGENGDALPSRRIERKVGDWSLASWNVEPDRREGRD